MHRDEDIALIGLAGRFPGASNINALWENSCQGIESIHRFSPDELARAGVPTTLIQDPNYVPAKGIIDDVERFDAGFFGISEQDAKILDPQQRLFLMSTWEALEHAGYAPRHVPGRVGVFASTGISLYLMHNILRNPEILQTLDEYQVLVANDKDFLATRVSYLLNLKGPSVNIQTGCSSSLVCIHYAIQSLLNGESDIALAGGVSITLPQEQGYFYRKEMIGSADGHCYAFDKQAQGTIKSNGVGVVVLKPLKDALRDQDTVFAVIRGSAINNDGSQKVGYAAPNATQQAAVIQEAMRMAEVEAHSIGYIETHGTGTLLGDPIELAALKQAFLPEQDLNKSCALVSLKTNIGHLDVAAGVASFIRACLALYHKKIPPSLNFSELNPKVSLENSPFFINTQLREWPLEQLPRRAGVSAFGVGGTNVHVILQEAPVSYGKAQFNKAVLCRISANSQAALQRNIQNLMLHAQHFPEMSLQDMAYTLHNGRERLPYRSYIVADSMTQFIDHAQQFEVEGIHPITQTPELVFMFSGQGAQYPGMGLGLYIEDPDFRNAFDEVLIAFGPHLNFDLKRLLHTPNQENQAEQLMQTEVAQPALFAIEYALAQSFLAKGLKPVALIGHSIGEYVAATLAGVFSLQDVTRLVAIRGRLVQQLPKGSMLAVHANAESLKDWLPSTVDIALENSPMNTVIAGETTIINELQIKLQQRNIRFQALHTSHAFHSRMLDPILDLFREVIATTIRHAPKIPIVSNVSGTWLSAEEACSIEYWISQLRQAVKFSQGIALLQKQYTPVFLEIGPGRTLQSLVNQQGIALTCNSMRHPYDEEADIVQYYKTLGVLWTKGIDSKSTSKQKRIPLPTYSWDLKRYWIDRSSAYLPESAKELVKNQDLPLADSLKNAWIRVLGVEPCIGKEHFFNQGGHSLAAIQLIDSLPQVVRNHVQVIDLYQYPTFSQFLAFIQNTVDAHSCSNSTFRGVSAESTGFITLDHSSAEAELFSDEREL